MDQNPKSQVVERLRDAQNVLITVSNNPTVDQLSAAIGFTLLMNKLGKHATAVFSGQIPSTIEFLKPEDTLEQNTDSLRDFIIALDKSKADKLRYKVEENVVKIFITPYRTSLSQADLDFSQGDFNVDAVVALGVDERDHIDRAITSHGRILHDATVIGVMAGQQQIDVGSINWQEPEASSLCEMLVSISEAFQGGLIDSQIATAFLTGIVAQTDRFSNDKTSPKVMTMAAQLMAAGANQQLIANKLEIQPQKEQPPQPIGPAEPETNPDEEGVLNLHEERFAKPEPAPAKEENKEEEIHIDGEGVLRFPAKEEISEIKEVKSDAEEPKKYSKYVTDQPSTGGVLTANAHPEDLDPSTDPLSQQDMHDAPEVQTHGKDVKPIEDDKKLGPEVENDETLQEIESSVQDYKEENPLDAGAAREAVQNAVEASYNPDMPGPIQSLNAQELKFDDNDTPPVPPPLVPPFPPVNQDNK